MKKIYLLTFISLGIVFNTFSEKRKILFLGNSYTHVNDLPGTLRDLALSLGDTIEFDQYTPGGSTFQTLYNDANTLTKIQIPGWDYVVLQAQSQEPSFSPAQVAANTYPYAKLLDSLIHVYNPCAETVFYMTWGRKNGDAGNCAVYPPVCTYEGMQQRLRESYLEMSDDNNATCAPVGVVWRAYRNQYPLIDLYQPDESHPSIHGTYLAACTFYSTLYHKSTSAAQFVPVGIGAADGFNIQNIASALVLDSLEKWQQYGSLPFAGFTFTNNQNQFSFTNTSLRSTAYDWDFGDGSPLDNAINPVHTYGAVGNYTVKLVSKTACGKWSTISQTINVSSIPNAVGETADRQSIWVHYFDGQLHFAKGILKMQLTDMNGAMVLNEAPGGVQGRIDIGFLPKGLYLYTLITKENIIIKGKISVQ